MLKSSLRQSPELEHFRLRGDGSSRLESFSDGIFSLSVGLLLITTSVPKNFDDLKLFMFDALPVLCCIGFVYLIWKWHAVFFLRYGMTDDRTVKLNFLLLFFVLFYVFPLKFLMSWLIKFFVAFAGSLAGKLNYETEMQAMSGMISFEDIPLLMLIYGAGFSAIFLIFFWLHEHACHNREALGLSEIEYWSTVFSARLSKGMAMVGGLSVGIALVGVLMKIPFAGFFSGIAYNLIWVFGMRHRKKWDQKMKELNIEPAAV